MVTLLTPELAESFCKVVAAGNYRIVAAAAVGVTDRSVKKWIARGKKEESGIYREFMLAVEKAEGSAERAMVRLIRKSARTDWHAAAWYLERKFNERWGRQDRTIIAKSEQVAPLVIGGAANPGALCRVPDA
jgi:hypothetical protein